MSNLTISIFGNKILSDITNEIKLFSKFQIKYYDDFSLCIREAENFGQLVIMFSSDTDKKDYIKFEKNKFPLIIISNISTSKNFLSNELTDLLNMPFAILDLNKKIISLLSKYEFSKSSLISLGNYTIDKNERKIKKSDMELQLTEMEINFLILFSKNNKPLNRNFFLKNLWHYSLETDTHTIETHIHRLRKKIFDKFKDRNFIKNNNKGYYI